MSRRNQQRNQQRWCGYCEGYRDHKEQFCPHRTTEPVMAKMLARWEQYRPLVGYEYEDDGQYLAGGRFKFFIVFMSSGINWPYRKLNADFSTFYEGPG